MYEESKLPEVADLLSRKIPADAYAIIIGSMKCGTSSLYTYLSHHPEICPAVVKEPEYFSQHQDHGATVKCYEHLWTFDASAHRYALESSTGYTKYPEEMSVPKNMFDYGIRPRFIYIIRNPFDRIQSHYNFMTHKNEDWRLDVGDRHIINVSKYYTQLNHYRPFFPNDSFLVLDFDNLKNDPGSVLVEIYNFLGISPSYFPENYVVKNVTLLRSDLHKRLSQISSSMSFPKWPQVLRAAGKKVFEVIDDEPKPRTLTAIEREFIYHELREDMLALHEVYGCDVRKWGFE